MALRIPLLIPYFKIATEKVVKMEQNDPINILSDLNAAHQTIIFLEYIRIDNLQAQPQKKSVNPGMERDFPF